MPTMKSISRRITAVQKHSSPTVRIGLLTPYAGSNQGDSAIRTEVIRGVRHHIPEAELWGIDLLPTETARLHGIPAFPITGLLVPFYSESLFEPMNGMFVRFSTRSLSEVIKEQEGEAPVHASAGREIWQHLKGIPVVGWLLKCLLRCVRRISIVMNEARHIRTSFQFLKGLDMVMVSGGGQLSEKWGGPWGQPYVLLRWGILARLARKRFVVVSVGVGELKTLLGRFFTRMALSLACYRSYRDLGSKEMLGTWSFTKNDPYVPDLAFTMHVNTESSAEIPGVRPLVVGVGMIAYGRHESWPTDAPNIYDDYLSNVADFIASLASKGHKVVLFKSSGADRYAVMEVKERILREWPPDVGDQISARLIETLEELLQEIKKVDVVVASRLHSVILSHMSAKPVLTISYDRKVERHVQDVGQEKYMVDIRNFTSTDLMERFEDLMNNAAAVKAEVSGHILDFRGPLEKQYDYLCGLLSPKQSDGD
jgi:polysaccharide pyruvyl transferase WcaK-like protein